MECFPPQPDKQGLVDVPTVAATILGTQKI